MDVAGGKGELGFQLVNLNGIRCTTVDPRRTSLERSKRKLVKGLYHRTEPLMEYVGRKVAPVSSDDVLYPAHAKVHFDRKLLGLIETENTRDIDSNEMEFSKLIQSSEKTLDEDAVVDTTEFHETIQSFAEMKDILLNCSIIVGMHPDQATEPIVDFALRYNKPFAILPCCVFAQESPNRRLRSGETVKSYDQFVTYLQEKSSLIRVAQLDFEGRNTLLHNCIL